MDKLLRVNGHRLPNTVWAFLDDLLVECPRCRGQAHVLVAKQYHIDPARLVCGHCGYVSQASSTYRSWHPTFRQGLDPFFGLPLWLRQSIGREFVWAYNARHLEDLEFFLRGEWKAHRSNLKLPGHNPNWSWRTRYPKWMQEKSNRPALLHAAQRMRRRL